MLMMKHENIHIAITFIKWCNEINFVWTKQ